MQTIKPFLPNHFFYKSLIIAYAYLETKGSVTLISGPSMYPTLNTDQRSKIPDLVWSKSDFKPSELEVGDIVILASPLQRDYNFCKRIAALDDTFVYTSESPIPVYVPPGHFWALGDNPRNSLDSDQFGPVSQSLIKGVVTMRLYPWSKEAVKRKVVSRDVMYQDPLQLLQQQFDKYNNQKQLEEVSVLMRPINYVNGLLFGKGESQGEKNNTTTATTITTPDLQTGVDNPNGLTPEDIAFNTYQREEAERHLQLLLNEQGQSTQVRHSQTLSQQREQFLRNAGKWKDDEDDYSLTHGGQAQAMGTTSQNSQQQPQQQQQQQQPKEAKINTTQLYNPFEARYGPIK